MKIISPYHHHAGAAEETRVCIYAGDVWWTEPITKRTAVYEPRT